MDSAPNSLGTPVTEGRATVNLGQGVFYNPSQVFNRDISTLALYQYCLLRQKEDGESFRPLILLDALAASGLRGIRYCREIPPHLLGRVDSNDLSQAAVNIMRNNISQNGEHAARMNAINDDAVALCQRVSKQAPEERYDVIDVDPYGSPTIFLEAALTAVKPGGMLCVTSTDLQILCTESQLDVCYQRYGAVAATWPGCKEVAIRIALGFIVQTAARLKIAIEPLLCFYHNHYLRCFVRVWPRPCVARLACTHMGPALVCRRCGLAAYLQSGLAVRRDGVIRLVSGGACPFPGDSERKKLTCALCGSIPRMAGPMYQGTLCDVQFASGMIGILKAAEDRPLEPLLQTRRELEAQLIISISEAKVDASTNDLTFAQGGSDDEKGRDIAAENSPTLSIWDCGSLASLFTIDCPRRELISAALIRMGYVVAPTHTMPQGFKTNAPPRVVIEVLAAYAWDVFPDKVRSVIARGLPLQRSTRFGLAARLLIGPFLYIKSDSLDKLLPAIASEITPQSPDLLPALLRVDAGSLEPNFPHLAEVARQFGVKSDVRASQGLFEPLPDIDPYLAGKGDPPLWVAKPPNCGPQHAAPRDAPRASDEKAPDSGKQ